MSDVLRLESILDSTVSGQDKGIPPGATPFPLRAIGRRNWNVLRADLPLPVVVLRASAMEHNVQWMRSFAKAVQVEICPHGKTTMSPQLFETQLRAGAWGITAATVNHVRVYRDVGVQRIFMANQLVGPEAIAYVLGEIDRDPAFDFYCLVDCVAGVELLENEARRRRAKRPLQVLLETGPEGGRCGARTLEERIATAKAVAAAAPYLALRGVEGFEGVVQATADTTDPALVNGILGEMVATAEALEPLNVFAEGPLILTAGGSAFFDLAAQDLSKARLRKPPLVVIRSGCYIVHDSEWCDAFFHRVVKRTAAARELSEGLRPALELWAYVQSRPERGRIVVTFGKRDASHDAGLPVATQWFRPGTHDTPQALPTDTKVVKMNDQHAMLSVDESAPFAVGDMMSFGISHPCTTFDKWRVLPVVDDDYTVIRGVRTFF